MPIKTFIGGETHFNSSTAMFFFDNVIGCHSFRGDGHLEHSSDAKTCPVCEKSNGVLYGYYLMNPSTSVGSPHPQVYSFARSASSISDVKAVTFQIENDIVRIWTFIPKRDKSVRRSIYEIELALMEKYQNTVFDFNVVTIQDLSEPFIPLNIQGNMVFFRSTNGN